MGLFEKKTCVRCGKELGLLFGKTKIADGQICKDCNSLLSPNLSGRSGLTLAQIEEHIKYRETNKAELANFKASKTIEGEDKVFIDMDQKKFVVASNSNFVESNADIISFSQVSLAEAKIDEESEEIFKEDEDGNEVSYDPKQYEYSYSYKVNLTLSHPWIKSMVIEVSDGEIDEAETEERLNALNAMQEIVAILSGTAFTAATEVECHNTTESEAAESDDYWYCPDCGKQNPKDNNFCTGCGHAKPNENKFCSGCGNKLEADAKFCPKCGKQVQ